MITVLLYDESINWPSNLQEGVQSIWLKLHSDPFIISPVWFLSVSFIIFTNQPFYEWMENMAADSSQVLSLSAPLPEKRRTN